MSNTLVLDRIESNLTRLRLPRIREIWIFPKKVDTVKSKLLIL